MIGVFMRRDRRAQREDDMKTQRECQVTKEAEIIAVCLQESQGSLVTPEA